MDPWTSLWALVIGSTTSFRTVAGARSVGEKKAPHATNRDGALGDEVRCHSIQQDHEYLSDLLMSQHLTPFIFLKDHFPESRQVNKIFLLAFKVPLKVHLPPAVLVHAGGDTWTSSE